MAPQLHITHFDPEEAAFSFGSSQYPIRETSVLVTIEFKEETYDLHFVKIYQPDSLWELEGAYFEGDYYEVDQLFSPFILTILYQFVLNKIREGLNEVEEQERYIYGKYEPHTVPFSQKETNTTQKHETSSQDPLNDENPLVRVGLGLTQKIALKGKMRLGFGLSSDGLFLFVIPEGEPSEGYPALTIGMHEIMYSFDTEADFIDYALNELRQMRRQ